MLKRLKDFFDIFRSDAAVGNGENNLFTVSQCTKSHTALMRVLSGVVEQVEDNLLNTNWVNPRGG